MGYAEDRQWSDRYIPAIKCIVGPRLLSESPFEVDTRQAADLIVMRARDMTVACRVRRPGYADKYPFEFTIRSKRENGTPTELQKLIDGWGDWMFYGHACESKAEFTKWFLIDLNAWRAAVIRCAVRGIKPYAEKSNGDGTHFVAFDLRDMKRIVIASSHEIPAREAA
jgi:hypothetical protein